MAELSPRIPASFVLALACLGLAITLTVIPSPFTVDDVNYLVNVVALRHGGLTVANTAGLTPSRELLFFDPTLRSRVVEATPVVSNAPPLYAVLALPFAWLGWRGLVALNTLAYLATILMVFMYARRHAASTIGPWLGAVAFALGGFALEYAQGVWPHALSMALCMGGVMAVGRSIDGGRPRTAAVAGLLFALAAGVRYQNAAMLLAAGVVVACYASHRWRSIGAFGVAAAVPLSASAVLNFVRLHSWNPISKGPGYLTVPNPLNAGRSWLDPLLMFWGQVVDASARPRLIGRDLEFLTYDPTTGAQLMLGVIAKKAVLQSAPWAVLAILLFAIAWAPSSHLPDARPRQVRLLSIFAIVVVAMFSFAGVQRHDGLAFNQRYLLELLPLAAVVLAWAVDGIALEVGDLLAGVAVGVGLVLAIILGTPIDGGSVVPLWVIRQRAILKLPLVMAAVLAGLWAATRRGFAVRRPLSVVLGTCLGWGVAIHLAQDVAGAQRLRAVNLARTNALAEALPDHSALVAWFAMNAAAPLLLDRDVVVLWAGADEGRDAPRLIREMLASGRRVFVMGSGFPDKALALTLAGFQSAPPTVGGLPLVELTRPE